MTGPRVFVSHNHNDSDFCRAFVNGLRAYNVDVWYDEHNVGAGALRDIIEREMSSRPHFLVVLSPAAVASRWVAAEIDAALELERAGALQTFLPVIARKCDVPLMLRRYRIIGQPDGSPLPIDQAVLQTMRAIWSDGPAPAPAPLPASTPSSSPTPSPAAGNQGIVMSGGTITAGALAVGPHAQATHQTVSGDPARQEVLDKLQALVQALQAHAAELHNADELAQSTTLIAREVAQPQPNKLTIQALLQGIAQNVQSVGSVVMALDALKAALGPLLH